MAQQQASSAAAGAIGAGTAIFPAVAGATDLTKEPTISAGAQPAPTTLQTRDLVVGTGATAAATSTVTIHYVGANYADGKDFDASWTDPGGPTATFSLTNTVHGFAQGIAGMKVGGRREIVIPPSLGYGAQANGPISANETLVFVVDLLAVK
jgi:peptidylprolyl isomerase